TGFLMALAKVDRSAPRILSRQAHQREQQAQQDEQARIQQQVQDLAASFTQQLAHMESTFQQRLAESAATVESTMQRHLSETVSTQTVHLQAVTETLSVVPELKERLTQVERAVQAQPMTEAGQQQAISRSRQAGLRVVPTGQQRAERRRGKREAGQEKFVLDAFVYECLKQDSSLKIEAIQQRARACGQSISIGSISRYRKQYFERQHSLSLSECIESESVAETER
ncbi:MAG: hypothetical protein JO202_11410, partial [Ktedonobacteraceae bacterium]|nr:hypothetical protein [Ktedonobacteraceae bacterium]